MITQYKSTMLWAHSSMIRHCFITDVKNNVCLALVRSNQCHILSKKPKNCCSSINVAWNLDPVFYINQARDILRPRTVPVNWRQILHYAQRLSQQNPICWDKMCRLAVSDAISTEADTSAMPTLISNLAKILQKKSLHFSARDYSGSAKIWRKRIDSLMNCNSLFLGSCIDPQTSRDIYTDVRMRMSFSGFF